MSGRLDDVRAAADFSKSQLYHYFADKDALVREVIVAHPRALNLCAKAPPFTAVEL